MNLCKYLCVSGKLFIRTQIARELRTRRRSLTLNSRTEGFWTFSRSAYKVYKHANMQEWKYSTLLVCMYAWIHYKNVDFEIRYPTLRGPYFCQILINFKNSWHFCNQNFVGFAKMTKSSIQCALEPEKLQKKKCPKY